MRDLADLLLHQCWLRWPQELDLQSNIFPFPKDRGRKWYPGQGRWAIAGSTLLLGDKALGEPFSCPKAGGTCSYPVVAEVEELGIIHSRGLGQLQPATKDMRPYE